MHHERDLDQFHSNNRFAKSSTALTPVQNSEDTTLVLCRTHKCELTERVNIFKIKILLIIHENHDRLFGIVVSTSVVENITGSILGYTLEFLLEVGPPSPVRTIA